MSPPRRKWGSMRVATTLVTLVMLALGGTGFWLFNGKKPEPGGPTRAPRFSVRRGDLPITLREVGTFSAEEALKVRAEIRGSARIVWLAEEGSLAKKGDILVELDKTDVEADIETLVAQVENAKANLVVARADEEIRRLDCESRIRKAEMDLDMAILEIKKFNEGTKPKELRDGKIKIEQATVELARVTAINARMPDMFKQGFVTKEEVQQSDLDVQKAKNELESARLEMQILINYTHPMQLKKLVGEKDRADAEIERYNQEAKRREAQSKAATTQRTQELSRAERRLKEARERHQNMTIRAEGNGIIVYGSGVARWWRPEEIKVGATAHRHQILMRLPDLDTMQVVVKIHEADVRKIRVDKENPQPVTITTDSMRGKTFAGYVEKIDTLAQGDWGREHVKRFSTTIALKEQIPGIRPGMTGNVEILVKELKDVLYVPIQAVHTRHGKSYCYVATDGGEPDRRAVVVGASNNNFAEIKQGLKDGEQVLLVRPETESGDEDSSEEQPARKTPYARRGRRRSR